MKPTPLISKSNFPIFKTHPDLVYLDNAATQQLHKNTIKAISDYHKQYNANPSRGLYELSTEAGASVEEVRDVVRDFIGLNDNDDVIFTRNATESINIVALSLTSTLTSDDEIIVFTGEHHSNLLPWMELSRRTGARLVVLECDFSATDDFENFATFLTPNVRVVAVSGMSNVTGYQPDLGQVSKTIRNSFAADAIFVVDAAQLVAHNPFLLYDVDYDAVAFSGHKLGAPTGIGVLALSAGILEHLTPVYTGGETVDFIHMTDCHNGTVQTNVKYRNTSDRFEAGTQNIGGIIGLGAALKLITYGTKYASEPRQSYEKQLFQYLLEKTKNLPHLKVHFAENGIFTFNIDDVHPHDIAQLLSDDHICVRAGFHCAQPLHEMRNIGPTVRASLAWYNDTDDIDHFVKSLKTVRHRMGIEERKQ